jgi:hypothetical protein
MTLVDKRLKEKGEWDWEQGCQSMTQNAHAQLSFVWEISTKSTNFFMLSWPFYHYMQRLNLYSPFVRGTAIGLTKIIRYWKCYGLQRHMSKSAELSNVQLALCIFAHLFFQNIIIIGKNLHNFLVSHVFHRIISYNQAIYTHVETWFFCCK